MRLQAVLQFTAWGFRRVDYAGARDDSVGDHVLSEPAVGWVSARRTSPVLVGW